jgi:hypothetical protein
MIMSGFIFLMNSFFDLFIALNWKVNHPKINQFIFCKFIESQYKLNRLKRGQFFLKGPF